MANISYPKFGKVKTIVIPSLERTGETHMNEEQYFDAFGIKLRDLVKLENDRLYPLDNTLYLIEKKIPAESSEKNTFVMFAPPFIEIDYDGLDALVKFIVYRSDNLVSYKMIQIDYEIETKSYTIAYEENE